jgi:hypothetical protein
MPIRDYARTVFRFREAPEPLTKRQAIKNSIFWVAILASYVLVYLDAKPIMDADAAMADPKIIVAQKAMNERLLRDLRLDDKCPSFPLDGSDVAASTDARQCLLNTLLHVDTAIGAAAFVTRARPRLGAASKDSEMRSAAERAVDAGWADLERNAAVYRAQDVRSAAFAGSAISRLLHKNNDHKPIARLYGEMFDRAELRAFAGDITDRQVARHIRAFELVQ